MNINYKNWIKAHIIHGNLVKRFVIDYQDKPAQYIECLNCKAIYWLEND